MAERSDIGAFCIGKANLRQNIGAKCEIIRCAYKIMEFLCSASALFINEKRFFGSYVGRMINFCAMRELFWRRSNL